MSVKNLCMWFWMTQVTIRSSAAAQCNLQGNVKADSDWVGFSHQFMYSAGAKVDFSYNITYSRADSIQMPIMLIIYRAQQSYNISTSTDCFHKLEQSYYEELANLKIELSEDNFWSGCETISGQRLRCIGGRNFVTVTNTTFSVAAARCGFPPIQMEHSIGFQGYTGECQGVLTPSSDQARSFTENILIVTIITVINATILVLAVIYLACRKCRLRSASVKV
ncbi:uncharacterized protein [Watersipora subatra]